MEAEFLISEQAKAGAIIVGLQIGAEQTYEAVQEDLLELESLLATLKIPTVDRLIQKRIKLSASHLLGLGKAQELADMVAQSGAKLVILDHSLSGPQVRNLEKVICCQVLDRAAVILDIFAKHAKSNQSKTQVEIAKLEYLLPRLAGAWTHFQRQTGGGVRARGMGEKQIEVDRRRARERISRLQKKLEQIKREREVQRKSRQNEIKVAIVGYTNSGKTTVMKGLTRASTDGKNELFATLDASTRAIDPNTKPKILLSDTVGFIRNLPHSLVDSFKSTLEEVLNADLLVHVVDISHPKYQVQMETTESVLEEIGAGQIPSILVFNKIDQVDEHFLPKILEKKYAGSLTISAMDMESVRKLRKHVFDYFETRFVRKHILCDAGDQAVLSQIHSQCVILDANYDEPGIAKYVVRAPEHTLKKLSRYIVDENGHSQWSGETEYD